MIYIAKHFVKIAGRKYTPGEIITSAIPDDKLQRLLRLNAIEGQEADVGGPEASGALDCPTADAGTHGSEDALHDSKSDDEGHRARRCAETAGRQTCAHEEAQQWREEKGVKVRIIKTDETITVNNSYGLRLLEQGRAVVAEEKERKPAVKEKADATKTIKEKADA